MDRGGRAGPGPAVCQLQTLGLVLSSSSRPQAWRPAGAEDQSLGRGFLLKRPHRGVSPSSPPFCSALRGWDAPGRTGDARLPPSGHPPIQGWSHPQAPSDSPEITLNRISGCPTTQPRQHKINHSKRHE